MIWRLGLLFVLSLCVGLVAYAPVEKIAPRVLPPEAGLKLYELEGDLFRGRAGYVEFRQLGARNVNWTIHPLSLLALRLAADVEISLDSRDPRKDNAWLSGSLNTSLLSGRVRITGLEAMAPLAALQKPLELSFLPMSGNLYLSLTEMELANARPRFIDGRARLLDARFLVGRPARLGNYQAELQTENEVIQARVEDEASGTVDLEASAELNPDGSYRLNARVKPKADTPAPVANSMKALGRTDRQGWYKLSRQGALPGF